jgi:hypothetical protein
VQHFQSERDDRANLLALLAALDASPLALQRDLSRGEGRKGDWGIRGKLGHIYADGADYLLCVSTEELPRRWTHVKRRLGFCNVTQDGDDEGCLRLDRLPVPHEVEAIREAIGIRKRRRLTPEGRAQLEAARGLLDRPLSGPAFAQSQCPLPW